MQQLSYCNPTYIIHHKQDESYQSERTHLPLQARSFRRGGGGRCCSVWDTETGRGPAPRCARPAKARPAPLRPPESAARGGADRPPRSVLRLCKKKKGAADGTGCRILCVLRKRSRPHFRRSRELEATRRPAVPVKRTRGQFFKMAVAPFALVVPLLHPVPPSCQTKRRTLRSILVR